MRPRRRCVNLSRLDFKYSSVHALSAAQLTTADLTHTESPRRNNDAGLILPLRLSVLCSILMLYFDCASVYCNYPTDTDISTWRRPLSDHATYLLYIASVKTSRALQ